MDKNENKIISVPKCLKLELKPEIAIRIDAGCANVLLSSSGYDGLFQAVVAGTGEHVSFLHFHHAHLLDVVLHGERVAIFDGADKEATQEMLQSRLISACGFDYARELHTLIREIIGDAESGRIYANMFTGIEIDIP